MGTSGACPIILPEGQILPPRSKYLIPIVTVKTEARTKLGCSSVMGYINHVPYPNNLTQEAAPFMPGTKIIKLIMHTMTHEQERDFSRWKQIR